MKAPLRFLFGWVLYVTLFAMLNPVIDAIWQAVLFQDPIVPIVTAFVGLMILITLYLWPLSRFISWCDQPRAAAPNTPHEVK